VLETLDAAAVRRWCTSGLAGLRRHQREIDQLNVYPVPDGDTGTNLVHTLDAAEKALADARPAQRAGEALRVLAKGALMGARGNSGVIVSQIFRGLADTLADGPTGGRAVAEALREAAAAAYKAVAEPVEGTVLTVAAAAARGAADAASDDLPAVVRAATHAATEALARTPQQLPALARAGVVDAGGRGLVVLLEALVEVVTGAPAEVVPPAYLTRGAAPVVTVAREMGSPDFGYEVQYLLDAEEAAVATLRSALAALGDSLVVVGAPADPGETPTWNVHVHVNDVGAAIEAGVVAGRPHRISVTRFADQTATGAADRVADGAADGTGATPEAFDPQARAVVVVAPGDGLAALFRGEGATVVGGNPSTEELIAAVRATRAGRVVVLPNDANARAVASAAAGEAADFGVRVRVVPTRSPVQALAALAVRDERRRFDDDVIAMAEAAGACRYGEVCHASREALTMVGRCHPGDVLGLLDGEVHLVGLALEEICCGLLDRMLGGGGELVTLVLGADAPEALADALHAHLASSWPFVEVQSYEGGQPHYPLLVGVE
jgi:DAK2 domain fusion protein YloV